MCKQRPQIVLRLATDGVASHSESVNNRLVVKWPHGCGSFVPLSNVPDITHAKQERSRRQRESGRPQPPAKVTSARQLSQIRFRLFVPLSFYFRSFAPLAGTNSMAQCPFYRITIDYLPSSFCPYVPILLRDTASVSIDSVHIYDEFAGLPPRECITPVTLSP